MPKNPDTQLYYPLDKGRNSKEITLSVIYEGLQFLDNKLDYVIEEVQINRAAIEANRISIDKNTAGIEENRADIKVLTDIVKQNSEDIKSLKKDMLKTSLDINDLKKDMLKTSLDIKDLKKDMLKTSLDINGLKKDMLKTSLLVERNHKLILKSNKSLDRIEKNVAQNSRLIRKNTSAISKLTIRIDRQSEVGFSILSRLWDTEQFVQELKEKTAWMPKIYDSLDSMMGEVIASREERTFVHNRLDRHEVRIDALEKTCEIDQ